MNWGRRALSWNLKILPIENRFLVWGIFYPSTIFVSYTTFSLFYWTWTFLQGIIYNVSVLYWTSSDCSSFLFFIIMSSICFLRTNFFLNILSPFKGKMTSRRQPFPEYMLHYMYRLFINMSHHLLWFLHPDSESLWCRYFCLSMVQWNR